MVAAASLIDSAGEEVRTVRIAGPGGLRLTFRLPVDLDGGGERAAGQQQRREVGDPCCSGHRRMLYVYRREGKRNETSAM